MPKNDGGSELRVCISPQRQSRTSLWPRPGMRKHSLASAAPLHMSAWLCHPLIACRRKSVTEETRPIPSASKYAKQHSY